MDTSSSIPELFEPVADRVAPRSERLRHPLLVFPYTMASIGHFLAAYVVLATVWTGFGLAAVHWLEPSALGSREVAINEWFAERRTDGLTELAHLGSVPSDTVTVFGLMAIALIAVPLAWRRWHGWAFLVGALAMEAAVYQTANMIVRRPRPPVEQLEQVVNFSFPSGHTAAAVTFYVGLVIVVSWHTANRAVLAAVAVFGLVVPAIVATSRLYLGVHYLTDILAGAVLGLTAIAVALVVARRGLAATVAESDEEEPPHTTRLDLTES